MRSWAWLGAFLAVVAAESTPHPCAYIVMLYTDAMAPGTLVLGTTLNDVASRPPRYAMVTDDISAHVQRLLERNGWSLISVGATRPNPNGKHHKYYQSRLAGAYTKLEIYNMGHIAKRLVYLDTDTQVTENVDELCLCQGECGVVRSSFVNTGVLVVEPSEDMYRGMLEQVPNIPSYNGGEQGFTNWFFAGFESCPMFYGAGDPCLTGTADGGCDSISVGPDGLKTVCHRLPSYYNGDVGFHLLHNAWLFPKDDQVSLPRTEPKIVHHTLAIFKPWKWWSFHVMTSGWMWREAFVRTALYNPAKDMLLVTTVSAVPVLLWLYARRRFRSAPSVGVVPSAGKAVLAEHANGAMALPRALSRVPPWFWRSLTIQVWLWVSIFFAWAWMKLTVGDYPIHPYLGTFAGVVTHSVLVDLVWLHGAVGSALRVEARRALRWVCPATTSLLCLFMLFSNASVFKKGAVLGIYCIGYVGCFWSYLAWATAQAPATASVDKAHASVSV